MRKWLLPFIQLLTLSSVVLAQPSNLINIEVTTKASKSFVPPFLLSYQAKPGQTIEICGKISVPSHASTYAVVNIYTNLECSGASCSELFDKKEIAYHGVVGGISIDKPKIVVSSTRYPKDGYLTYQFSPGDYLEICWYLHVNPNLHSDGKVRAYFYAEEIRSGTVKDKYSDWVYVVPQQHPNPNPDINTLIYIGLGFLIAVAIISRLRS